MRNDINNIESLLELANFHPEIRRMIQELLDKKNHGLVISEEEFRSVQQAIQAEIQKKEILSSTSEQLANILK